MGGRQPEEYLMQPRRADFFFAAMYLACAAQLLLLCGQGSPGVLFKDPGKGRGALVGALVEISAGVGWGATARRIIDAASQSRFFVQLCTQPSLLKYCLVVKDPGVLLKDPGKGRGALVGALVEISPCSLSSLSLVILTSLVLILLLPLLLLSELPF